MGIMNFIVENIILKKTKKTSKKKESKKISLDFFKLALSNLPERTNLDDSYGKGVVKGNTVGRIEAYLNVQHHCMLEQSSSLNNLFS